MKIRIWFSSRYAPQGLPWAIHVGDDATGERLYCRAWRAESVDTRAAHDGAHHVVDMEAADFVAVDGEWFYATGQVAEGWREETIRRHTAEHG